MTQFRPMLAAKLKKDQTYEEVLPKLRWEKGFLASPKLDGIRITHHADLGPVTRSLKTIPNLRLRAFCEDHLPLFKNFDGELVFGDHETPQYRFQQTSGPFMQHDGPLEGFKFHVFDDLGCPGGFKDRIISAEERVEELDHDFLKLVPHRPIRTEEQLFEFEKVCLQIGYEGAMIRDPYVGYKYGRSTIREQGLIAIKRYVDAEAEILDFEPLHRNLNEPTIDARGYQVRSSHKDNKVADNYVGKFLVRGVNGKFKGVEFKVGSGLDDALRKDAFENFDNYRGTLIKYKYQQHSSKDKPRQPIFKGFRPKEDL